MAFGWEPKQVLAPAGFRKLRMGRRDTAVSCRISQARAVEAAQTTRGGQPRGQAGREVVRWGAWASDVTPGAGTWTRWHSHASELCEVDMTNRCPIASVNLGHGSSSDIDSVRDSPWLQGNSLARVIIV